MRITKLTKDQDKQVLIQRLSDQSMPLLFFYEEEPGGDVPHEKVGTCMNVVHPPYD